MRFTVVILSALLCSGGHAETKPVDMASDEAIMAAAEKLVSEGKTLKTEEVTSEAATAPDGTDAEAEKHAINVDTEAGVTAAAANAATTATTANELARAGKKESEIPFFIKPEKISKVDESLMWRLLASLALVCVFGAAIIFASRRWGRGKGKGSEKIRIEILHQYSLGPKKSLALVRVAGEALLIGCTDHSINLIKAVTLIDDELEGLLGKDFSELIEDDFRVEDVRKALSPVT